MVNPEITAKWARILKEAEIKGDIKTVEWIKAQSGIHLEVEEVKEETKSKKVK